MKRQIAVFMSAVLCAPMLTGCGFLDNGEPKEGSDKDYDAAEAALESFLDARCDDDRDEIEKYSDYESGIPWCAVQYEMTEREAKSKLKQVYTESYLTELTTYDIGDGEQDLDTVEYYGKFCDYLKNEAKETGDDDMKELQKKAPKIKYIYTFPVTMETERGGYDTYEYDVAKMNGKWTVVCEWLRDMREFRNDKSLEAANTAAKCLYHAVNSAIVDMDSEDTPIRPLEGTHKYSGTDFEGMDGASGTDRSTDEGVKADLRRKTYLYFSDVTKLDEMTFAVEQGACKQTAVCLQLDDPYTGESRIFYGTYPLPVTEEQLDHIQSVDDLLGN